MHSGNCARRTLAGLSPSRALVGKNRLGKQQEIDLLTQSYDGTSWLAGECKWGLVTDPVRLSTVLKQKFEQLPFYHGEEITTLIFGRSFSTVKGENCITPAQVLEKLKW